MAAAVLSGVAFYAISGIWTSHNTESPNYIVNFASWCVAFLPGFMCLFVALPGALTRRESALSS